MRCLATALSSLLLCAPALANGVVITEVHSQEPEFVELHNPGSSDVDLAGYSMGGEQMVIFAEQQTLPAGGYLLVLQARRPFTERFGPGARFVVGNFRSRLRDGGGRLRLYAPGGDLIDEVRWGPTAEGRSLQRLDATSAYRGPLNWIQAAPTPGQPCAGEARLPAQVMDRPTCAPARPSSRDPLKVSVRVHGAPKAVAVAWETRHGRGAQVLRRASAAGSAAVYEGEIPAQPDQTLVRYTFLSDAEDGTRQALERDWAERLQAYVFDGAVETTLPLYCLEIEPKALALLTQGEPERERLSATLVEVRSGVVQDVDGDATVHVRGNLTREWRKRSWVVRRSGERGDDTLYLRTNWKDATSLREVLAYDLYRRAGVPAPRARRVRVHVNGAFYGVFTEVETPDERFLQRNGLAGGVLYQAQSFDLRTHGGKAHSTLAGYERSWSKQTHRDEPFTDLRAFIEGYEACAPEQLETYFEERLDVEAYLRYLGVNVLITHWDSMVKNFFWCLDREGSGKWVVIPWDLDLTWGDYFHGAGLVANSPVLLGVEGLKINRMGRDWWNRLRDRFLSVPSFRQRLYQTLRELLKTELQVAELDARIDALLRACWSDLVEDRSKWGALERMRGIPIPFRREHLVREVGLLKTYVRSRRRFLEQECERALGAPTPEGAAPSAKPPFTRNERTGHLALILLVLWAAWYLLSGRHLR